MTQIKKNKHSLPDQHSTITDAGREARARYQREYYARNKARVKGWQDAYWQRKAEGGVNRRAEED